MLKRLLMSLSFLMLAQVACAQQNSAKLGQGYEFANNGKVAAPVFEQMYIKNTPKIGQINISPNLQEGAAINSRLLARISAQKVFSVDNLEISGKQLRQAASIIDKFAASGRPELLQQLACYQIKGEDDRGNVHFTGYFTPRLEAREKPDKKFKYPIYTMPKGSRLPTRKAIDHENALAGQGLELAYTSSLLDNFFLSVQGSGILDFGKDVTRLIGYAGSNKHSYRSVGKILISNGSVSVDKISLRTIRAWFAAHPEQLVPTLNKNTSYTFFKWRNKAITGAAGVPLAPMHSIAVDKSCIPYGACLLAEVPVLDANGTLAGHQWQILFAHDTGGAIRGPGHIDLYHGQGTAAGDSAGDLHHYGRLWLLLPEE